METPIISYNLKDRARRYRGQERNFDIKKISAAINSGETQERVKNRDMLGYYGHWARVKFGMNVCEGNAQTMIEPAIVTTFLEAKDDGTVTHKAEFLQTKAGQIAEQLFKSRTGGFSSAIDESRPEFFGFDYVLEPNYSANRGYELVLDSVTGGYSVKGMTLDDIVAADYNDQISAALFLIRNLTNANQFTLDSLKSLQEENEELMSMIVNQERQKSEHGIFSIDKQPTRQILDDIGSFRSASLPRFESKKTENKVTERVMNLFLNR